MAKNNQNGLRITLAAGALVLAACAAYHNIFSAPFVFDDIPAIVENPTIRTFREALSPPTDKGTSAIGRPIFNLSLALNYALGGLNVRGYHATNLLIHALATLALFGVVRRTLLRPGLRQRFGDDALPLAFTIALLWAVHPLLTESVTLSVQRTESLMGLFYLLAFYAFVRGAESLASEGRYPQRAWFALCAIACLFGIGTKEVTATAPVLVLLYDRTFLAGSFREAWRSRWRVHLALFSTWLPLAWLMAGTSNRGGTVGLGLGMSAWTYLLTQCQAVVMYLRLSLWPHPLVMDYGSQTIRDLVDVFPQALLLLALFGATVFALWRRPVLGFVGAWFFVILAPSSSIIPLRTQTIAEHRMYLPLAAVIVFVATIVYALAARRSLVVLFTLGAAAGFATARRNADYRSAVVIWTDTVEKSPANARAHYSLGVALSAAGRVSEAITHYEEALRLEPDYKEHNKLAVALAQTNRLPEALQHFELSLQLKPDFAESHENYGVALARAHRFAEAALHYETALRLDPASAEAHYNFANALVALERVTEAMRHYEAAVRLKPDYASAHTNLANTLLMLDRPTDAISHYETALRLEPANVNARVNLELVRQAVKPPP